MFDTISQYEATTYATPMPIVPAEVNKRFSRRIAHPLTPLKMPVLEKPLYIVSVPSLYYNKNISLASIPQAPALTTSQQIPMTLGSTYLYNNIPRQPIDNHMLLLQSQCNPDLVSQSLDIPFYFPYPGLVQIAAALGKMVYG